MMYWHLQMHLPYGPEDGTVIEPLDMLRETQPVIGTGEWDNVQCVQFKKEADIGDIVFVRRGNTPIALCKITGRSFTDELLTKKYGHVNFRNVEVLSWDDNKFKPRWRLFSQGTFNPCRNKDSDQCKFIKNWFKAIERGMFDNQCKRLLQDRKNIILQGAPGTGKTYCTASLAVSLVDGSIADNHQSVMRRYQELQADGSIFFTTFHQSLDYEDFVEGLKPQIKTDERGNTIGVVYEPEDGIFIQACKAAENQPNSNIVLIIDEINRGNVSKIFGELITLLEVDKRAGRNHSLSVILPYSKKNFAVPSNLYIIGTMNTTDQSTGRLDYALRRRFCFITLTADPNVIISHYEDKNDELGKRAVEIFNDIKKFMSLQNRIIGEYSIDDLMVGHSYFLAETTEKLKDRVAYEILPLISEYISDGIIKISHEEKERIFKYWKDLCPIIDVIYGETINGDQ